MGLVFYNTLKRKKEEFKPLDPHAVGMYVCGPTVYDLAHIGNARPYVVFDVLYRLLKKLYPKVTYVRNLTDVDDKIITAAEKNQESIQKLTERTTEIFHAHMAALNTLKPDIEPKATEHIQEMITLIETLIAKGHAYVEDNHVLFSVASDPDYGILSGCNRDEMIAGARVEVAPYKRDPADFILWKPSPEGMPGWQSPWGYGRPGWHIECSAMSKTYLGETFDIHAGGQDLIFPHHENEIAQSMCAHKAPFVRYWLHNGYLTVNGEKMSKSLGNFFTVEDLLAHAPGEAIRYALLSTHYRSPFDWTLEGLKSSKQSLDRLYTALRGLEPLKQEEKISLKAEEILFDDLNTPLALAYLHEVATALNKATDFSQKKELQAELLTAGHMLGLLEQDPEAWFKWQAPTTASSFSEEEILKLIAERKEARLKKDFALSDAIRDKLLKGGILLEDQPTTTLWRRL